MKYVLVGFLRFHRTRKAKRGKFITFLSGSGGGRG